MDFQEDCNGKDVDDDLQNGKRRLGQSGYNCLLGSDLKCDTDTIFIQLDEFIFWESFD